MRVSAIIWAELPDEEWDAIRQIDDFGDQSSALVAWLLHGAEQRHFDQVTVSAGEILWDEDERPDAG
jgi:hypothetical protein